MKQFNLDEYLKNPSKKIVTRDGGNVTIRCTNFRGIFPIIAEIESIGKSFSYNEDGQISYVGSSIYDLFFAPEEHEGWINVYRNRDTGTVGFGAKLYTSREEAEKSGKTSSYYAATAKIEWEE